MTTFDVAPNKADWYYCAVVETDLGDTTYVDGYASGDKPTRDALQEHSRCDHSWVAGMMAVHDEDVAAIAAVREVHCDDSKCGRPYAQRNRKPLKILEWEVKATPRAA